MKGFVNALLILVGLVIAGVLVGLFSNSKPSPAPLPSPTTTTTPTPPPPTPTQEDPNACGLHVQSVAVNSTVTSPITISGYTIAGPCWPSFEGQAGTVRLVDANSNALSQNIPVALIGDWMTTSPVNFNLTLNFTDPNPSSLDSGFLQFGNAEGPDGSQSKVFKIPVKF